LGLITVFVQHLSHKVTVTQITIMSVKRMCVRPTPTIVMLRCWR